MAEICVKALYLPQKGYTIVVPSVPEEESQCVIL